jgi:hypothetical protein
MPIRSMLCCFRATDAVLIRRASSQALKLFLAGLIHLLTDSRTELNLRKE